MEKIEELLEDENITLEEIYNKIKSNELNASAVISNPKFKEKLYNTLNEEGCSYSSVRDTMDVFGAKSCMENLDLDKIMSSPNSYRFFVAINENDKDALIDKVSKDDKYFKYYFNNIDNLYSTLDTCDYSQIKDIVSKLDKMEEKPANVNYFFSGISDEAKKGLMKDNLSNDTTLNIIKTLGKKEKQNFINNDPRALFMYKDMNVLAMIKEGIQFPNDILKQDDFFETLKGKDFVEFRKNINELYKNSYSYDIQNKVEKYRESIIRDYNPDTQMFNSYNISSEDDLERIDNSKDTHILDSEAKYRMHVNIEDKDKLKKSLQEESANKLSAVVLDALFEDTKNNVGININEMLRYTSKTDGKLLDNDSLEMYKKISDIDNLSGNEILEMYNECKDKNLMGKLYEDMNTLKKDSYKKISECVFKVKDDVKEFSPVETDKNDVETYKFKGDPFYMVVRTLENGYRERTNNAHSSYSLISDENLNVFNDTGFLYGYDNIDPNSIENVFESDSYTVNSNEEITNRPNRIMTPEEIVKSDSSYSEINIKNKINENYDGKTDLNKYKEMKPSYIVAMQEITEEQIEESKRLNIPIVVIDRERYKDRQIQNQYKSFDEREQDEGRYN